MAATSVSTYFSQLKEGDTTLPKKPVQATISTVLDKATAAAVNDLLGVLRASPEHVARVQKLRQQPVTAGKFAESKVILKKASPFEQMVALADWLGEREIRKTHTFFFSASDGERIPVSAKKMKNLDATMMHVVLGATRGAYKAPKYTDWAENDPWNQAAQKRFIRPLEELEIVRQPDFAAATMIKGNAFEMNLIDTKHRYGLEYASVEGPGQSKHSPKKIRSAGFNACTFTDILSDAADPTADEVNIARPIKFEDYANEGYHDDLDLSVTPGKVMKAAKRAIKDHDDTELNRLMENLTIAKLGVPRTPMLCEHIAAKIVVNGAEG